MALVLRWQRGGDPLRRDLPKVRDSIPSCHRNLAAIRRVRQACRNPYASRDATWVSMHQPPQIEPFESPQVFLTLRGKVMVEQSCGSGCARALPGLRRKVDFCCIKQTL